MRVIGARLRAPFVWARGSERSVSLVRLSLVGDDGVGGEGEAVALGAGLERLLAQLRDPVRSPPRLAQAAAAVDLARLDLEGRRAEQPVWRLLGATDPTPVEVNATIAAGDPDSAARLACWARAAGFRCVKVKVGGTAGPMGVADDVACLAAVRAAAGPEIAIRLDANGAWSVEEAIAALGELEQFGIELCEEPVSGLEGIAKVAAETSIPVALDESAALPQALERRVCDSVCLKVARCGGVGGVIDASRRARAAGYRVYLASTLDGPLGIAAALHAAALIRPELPCGLATLPLFEAEDPLPAVAGRIAVPAGPGLGEGLLGWYESVCR